MVRMAVAHTLRTFEGTTNRVKLIIDNVPEKTTHGEIAKILTEKGKASEFTEAGVPWANHSFKKESPKTGWGKGVTGAEEAPVIDWEALTTAKVEIKRITLRFEMPLYNSAVDAAAREGLSIQKWFEKITAEASGHNQR